MFSIAKRSDGAPVRVTIKEAQGDDPAAVVILVPIEPKMRRRALGAARRLLDGMGVEYTAVQEDEDLMVDVSEEIGRELMRLGIVGIEGIVAEETGEPFELTPDRETRLRTAADKDRPTGTIDDLLADESVLELLDAGYVIPDAKRRAEKNALSGSPDGTSKGATPGKGTANLAAKRKRRAGAKAARTRNTRSKPTKAKASGTS
jgi:hypothetical protein